MRPTWALPENHLWSPTIIKLIDSVEICRSSSFWFSRFALVPPHTPIPFHIHTVLPHGDEDGSALNGELADGNAVDCSPLTTC